MNIDKWHIAGIITIFIVMALAFCAGWILHAQTTQKDMVSKETVDNLKADSYTQGYIDGRLSILSEQNPGSIPSYLGVPQGYESKRTQDWRDYADCITYKDKGACSSNGNNQPLSVIKVRDNGSRDYKNKYVLVDSQTSYKGLEEFRPALLYYDGRGS